MTTPGGSRAGTRAGRRLVVGGIVLAALLAVLTTCVLVAQTGDYGNDGIGADPPSRASMSPPASASAEDSGPPATPWREVSWRDGTKKNQIIGIVLPPRPPPEAAREDPLRVSVALLAALDSTNPAQWRPGVNPLEAYMAPKLDRVYTPGKGQDGEDPGATPAEKLPAGAEASYEFYCHIASHTAEKVVSQCAFRVTTTSSGKVLRDDHSVEQRVTARQGGDGWRVSRIAPVAAPGGD